MNFLNAVKTVSVMLSVAVFLSVHADVIEPNYHPVTRCITIDNISDFPDIAIAGYYTGPTSGSAVQYLVEADSCLTKGYKFNTLYLFWVEKGYLDVYGFDDIPFEDKLPQTAKKKSSSEGMFGLLAADIEPYGGTVPDENPLVREDLKYRLNQANGSFGLSLAVKTSYFEDGTEKTEDFTTSIQPSTKMNMMSHSKLDAGISFGRNSLILSPTFSGNVSGVIIDCNGRTVYRFNRNIRNGATYLIPFGKVSAGMYWLQLNTGTTTLTQRLTTFE